MARTYGLIGTRPDLGAQLADAQLATLGSNAHAASTWGIGYFDHDEALLWRRKGNAVGMRLIGDGAPMRTHGLLAHECDGRLGPTRPEATPPLRYGHLLFSCQGVSDSVDPLVHEARRQLPEFLRSVVRGETLSELAFALLLSELAATGLPLSSGSERASHSAVLSDDGLANAMRATLRRLDKLIHDANTMAFTGDLWLHTGEMLMIAHRQGPLGMLVLIGRKDLQRWDVTPRDGAAGLDQALFVSLAAGQELAPSWERLPHDVIVTAARGKHPETQAL